MVNKKIIWTIVIVILIITVVIITNRKTEEQIPKDIVFGDECSKDDDCDDSFRICRDGIEVSCENGCVYGKCTKCVSVCPEESKCGNITCLDSIKICPDGRTVRCANYCDPYTRECTICIPECNITTRDGVNYPLKAGKFVLDSVPCVNANYTERREMKLLKRNITKIELPEGYSIIIGPFSVDKEGQIDLTLNIPETYADVKALRCRGQYCNPVVVEYVTELRCGGKVYREFLKGKEYLEPRLMPIKIKEVSGNVKSNQEIKSDKYNVIFYGNFERIDVTLDMPKEAVKEAKNPGLKIIGTPLVIKVRNKIKEEVNAKVTMPYTNLEGFEEDSVGMYIKIRDGWEYISGEINKEDKTVTANITNISRYLNEDNEIALALMGVVCISCYGSSLTKVYQPEEGSKIAIILIHGFNPEPNTYQEMIDDIRLTNQPFEVWTFGYSSSRLINETAKELMDLLEKSHMAYEGIYIVAHSLGGVIAQQALYKSYLENQNSLQNQEPFVYNYLEKVRKVILVGVSNEGSPVAEVYKNLFKSFVNDEKQALFNPKSKVIEDLVKGIITPRVPAIDYKVIAGTQTYGFNLLFFKLTTEELADIYEKNDGIITVKSAQHIGDKFINNQCEDYWEINLTHTELIDDPIARKVIEKIITEDISRKDRAILGHNKYFDLSVGDNLFGDTYVVIGKKIREELVLDETWCNCGNGYCGEGENEVNCPSDCARFLSEEKRDKVSVFLIMILVSLFIYFAAYKRLGHPHLKRLAEHIKTNYDIVPDEGYTHKQIKDALLVKGWPKRIIDDLMKILKKEFHHTYHKPLEKRIKRYLRGGYTKEQIKKILVDYGWKKESIEKVFRGERLEPSFKPKKRYKPKLEGERTYFGWNR